MSVLLPKLFGSVTLLLVMVGCSSAAVRARPEPAKPAVDAEKKEEPPRPGAASIFEGFIGTVPVKLSPEIPDGEIEISIVGFSGKDYGELGKRAGVRPGPNGRIRVALERLTNATDKPSPVHGSCSFVVDCDEPAVVGVADQAKAELGARPNPSALAKFVDAWVTDKSLARSEDLPSRVAVTRSGDCTEHALLFVALARHFEYTARDVSGFVLIAEPGAPPRQAFGHAWAEVHDGKYWRRIDPSLGVGLDRANSDPTLVAVAWSEAGKTSAYELRYLPVRVRGEEGPGYERENERGLSGLHIETLWWHGPK